MDSCGQWDERWGRCGEICGLHRIGVCGILWWCWCVGLWLLQRHGEHHEAFFGFCFHLGHIGFCLRSALSVLGDCLREGVLFSVCIRCVHCYTKLLVHCGAVSFSDLEFILIDHVFAENGPFLSVGPDDLVPSFEGFCVHSSAFGELGESVYDEVRLG